MDVDTYLPGNRIKPEFPHVSYHFHCEKGDTVFAVRKGVVIKIEEPEEVVQSAGVKYTNQHRHLSIEHEDGTVARYGQIENLMVETGDVVCPDTPLALASSFDYETYKFYLTISYRVGVPNTDRSGKEYPFAYIDPIFSTTNGKMRLTHGGTYSPKVDQELIEAEMSKRERKQRRR